MDLEQNFSSTRHALKKLVYTLFEAILCFAVVYFILITGRLWELLLSEQGFKQVFGMGVIFIVTGGAFLMFIYSIFKYLFEISSGKNWRLGIEGNNLIYQTPYYHPNKNLAIPLGQIRHIKKTIEKRDESTEIYWTLGLVGDREFELDEFAPFHYDELAYYLNTEHQITFLKVET